MLTRELLEAPKDVFPGQIAVLQPAFFILWIAHPFPALAMLQNDNTIAVAHSSGLGIHRRYPVTQKGLRCRHIEHLFFLAGAMVAREKGEYESEQAQNATTMEESAGEALH